MLIGIKAGESRSGSAGATRRRVTLSVNEEGTVATIDDRQILIGEDVVVFWWSGSADTFHGIKDAVACRTDLASRQPSVQDVKGVVATSSSGGGDIAALVFKVDRPLAILTSNYKKRGGWRILVFEPGKGLVFAGTPSEYRSLYSQVENL